MPETLTIDLRSGSGAGASGAGGAGNAAAPGQTPRHVSAWEETAQTQAKRRQEDSKYLESMAELRKRQLDSKFDQNLGLTRTVLSQLGPLGAMAMPFVKLAEEVKNYPQAQLEARPYIDMGRLEDSAAVGGGGSSNGGTGGSGGGSRGSGGGGSGGSTRGGGGRGPQVGGGAATNPGNPGVAGSAGNNAQPGFNNFKNAPPQAGNLGGGAGGAAGLIGAALEARKALTDALVKGVGAAGDSLKAVASLDGGKVVEGYAALLKSTGDPVSSAFGEVILKAKELGDSLSETAKKLSAYNGALATSVALADVAQTLGDIRRSSMLGTDLARFTDAKSRLSQASQDAMASILQKLLPLIVKATEGLTDLSRLASLYFGSSNPVVQIRDAVADAVGPLFNQIFSYYPSGMLMNWAKKHMQYMRDREENLNDLVGLNARIFMGGSNVDKRWPGVRNDQMPRWQPGLPLP